MPNAYMPRIKSKRNVLFTGEEMDEIIFAIKAGRLPKRWATGRAHVAGLKARFASTTTCPKCGGALVLRTAKAGAKAGSRFYGCSGFPGCRYVGEVSRAAVSPSSRPGATLVVVPPFPGEGVEVRGGWVPACAGTTAGFGSAIGSHSKPWIFVIPAEAGISLIREIPAFAGMTEY